MLIKFEVKIELPIPYNKDSIRVTISSPYIGNIRMNWGWGNYYYTNSTWCTLTGDWIANNKNYQYKRKMISGFKPTEQ